MNCGHETADCYPVLNQLIHSIPLPFAVMDEQLRYQICSRSWLTFYGIEVDQVLGQSHFDLFPDLAEEARPVFETLLSEASSLQQSEHGGRFVTGAQNSSWQIQNWKNPDGSFGGFILYAHLSFPDVFSTASSLGTEQQFHLLLDTSRTTPWAFEIASSAFIHMGAGFEHLAAGQRDNQCSLQDWLNLVSVEDRKAVARFFENIATATDSYDLEFRITDVKRDQRWVRAIVTGARQHDGLVSQVTGLFLDVSGPKSTENNLKQKKQLYRSVIETSGDGFWLANKEGYILETNDAYARLSGYTRDELIGMHLSQLEAKEKPEETARHIQKIISEGHDLFETRHRKKSGALWDVEISTSFTEMEGGRFCVFSRDISERNQIQQELSLIAEVFRNTSEGIIITDPRGVVIDVNPAYCEITGYERGEMIGNRPSIAKSDRHDEQFYSAMWHSLTTRGYWTGEIWDRRKNGQIFPKWLSINAVHNEHGKLSHYVGTFSDISALKDIERELEKMAYYDSLTKLPNRILFKDRLEHEINNCRRNNTKCAVLFLDLDRFKIINDTLGHSFGDDILVEVSKRIQKAIRDSDTIARFGGDEFMILLTQLNSADSAAVVAQNIASLLNDPIKKSNEVLHIGVSIGISIYPEDGKNYTTLTRHADAAMYEAKASGRGQYHFYSDYMDKSAREHMKIERDLYRAIDEQQLFLVFQPQIDTSDEQVVQCEALLRWKHPESGFISPELFIPIAEDSGLIHLIGDWVIREVCRHIRQWIDDGLVTPRVAINLSARQFRQSGLLDSILAVIEEFQVPLELIEFEITESVAMENADLTMQLFSGLTEKGFSIAIDDFGTGYSSLSYLKRFPVNKLKLDRSFVMDIQQDPNNAAISSAIVQMAHSLGIDVVAEGVETREQFDFLRKQGCRLMQGFYFFKPLENRDFKRYLKTRC